MLFLVDPDPPAWADLHCLAESVRRIDLVDLVPIWSCFCHSATDTYALQLSKVHEWAEIFKLREKRWPTDQELHQLLGEDPLGPAFVVAADPSGAFDLVHLGSDGAWGARCCFQDEQDLRWSEVVATSQQ